MSEIIGYKVEIRGNKKIEIGKEQFEILEKLLFLESPPDFLKIGGHIFRRDAIISISPVSAFGLHG